jgi:2-polyprenyl-6-hydroxyphenyl methylase/3-demethylubiquinone-9 3-methyltransferase
MSAEDPPVRFINQEAASGSGERISFSFGENWRRYLARLTPERIEQAQQSLRDSFGQAEWQGRRFLDVGCGSGLFSLCAFQLGARPVHSIDVDPNSVACAAYLRHEHVEASPDWSIELGSVLDRPFLETIEPADLVFSWGVLHHTGSLWQALENAFGLVRPGGLICVALYNHPRRERAQMGLKRLYNRLPRRLRPGLQLAYAGVACGVLLARGRNPVRYIREYSKNSRGMSFWRDVADWLGGLPCEFASEGEVTDFATARGLLVEKVLVRPPGGNNEYLLRRPA